jgi:hypothetical protein
MRSLTITGLIAALIVGTVVLLAAASPSAQDQETGNRAPFWPGTNGRPVVKEWYTDIPWHQKLGTFAGNEIDEALLLPYEALGEQEKNFCTNHKLTPEDCMLELGINNVLGTLRTDTLYNPQEAKIRNAKECRDSTLPCIEVMLELSSFWTRSTGSGSALQQRPFGKEPPNNDFYGGYTITDGSTYAPHKGISMPRILFATVTIFPHSTTGLIYYPSLRQSSGRTQRHGRSFHLLHPRHQPTTASRGRQSAH